MRVLRRTDACGSMDTPTLRGVKNLGLRNSSFADEAGGCETPLFVLMFPARVSQSYFSPGRRGAGFRAGQGRGVSSFGAEGDTSLIREGRATFSHS